MAIIRKKELHNMAPTALSAKLLEVRRELNTERGLIKSGGRSSNPGKIKELRRTVARILTLMTQKMALQPKKAAGASAKAGAAPKTSAAKNATAPAKTAGAATVKKTEVKSSA